MEYKYFYRIPLENGEYDIINLIDYTLNEAKNTNIDNMILIKISTQELIIPKKYDSHNAYIKSREFLQKKIYELKKRIKYKNLEIVIAPFNVVINGENRLTTLMNESKLNIELIKKIKEYMEAYLYTNINIILHECLIKYLGHNVIIFL